MRRSIEVLLLAAVLVSCGSTASTSASSGSTSGGVPLPYELAIAEEGGRFFFADHTDASGLFDLSALEAPVVDQARVDFGSERPTRMFSVTFSEGIPTTERPVRSVSITFGHRPSVATDFRISNVELTGAMEEGEAMVSARKGPSSPVGFDSNTGSGSVRVEPQPDGSLHIGLRGVVATKYKGEAKLIVDGVAKVKAAR